MTKRDVITKAFAGEQVPYTPWAFGFTKEASENLKQYLGKDNLNDVLDPHFLELGSGTGFFNDLGNDHFEDIFGVVWDRTVEKDIGNVANKILPEPDLSPLVMPDPDNPQLYAGMEERIAQRPDLYRRYCIGFSLYERAWTLRGMEDLMMDFLINPEFVHELFTTIADYNIAVVKNALKYDLDAVYFGDDWGQQSGLQMGYAHWKEFIYPQLKRMYAVVRDAGVQVHIHSCGDVDELFDDLVDIGLNCFNPFQPEVMDVAALHERYRGRLSFWGGLSTQRTLPHGTVEDVLRETHQLIEMGRNGNYVFSPAHAVEGDVPPENLMAVITALKAQDGYR